MNRPEVEQPLLCPSCGAPRLQHAWDCASCGAVFDQQGPTAGAATGEPDAAAPAVADRSPSPRVSSARRSSSARRAGPSKRPRAARPPGGGLAALREWVAANKTVAVIVSFVVYVVVIWLFGALIIGATDSPGAIKNAYRDLTGRPLPSGFGPTFAAHFVSRRLVVLDRPDQVVLALYRDEDGVTDADLIAMTEGALDLFEVPWERIRTRAATVADRVIKIPVFQLWGEGGPHLYLVPIVTTDGGCAVEAVIGPPERVLDVVDEMMRAR